MKPPLGPVDARAAVKLRARDRIGNHAAVAQQRFARTREPHRVAFEIDAARAAQALEQRDAELAREMLIARARAQERGVRGRRQFALGEARARERDPSLPEDEIAREALRTAEAVFREYTADTAEWNGEAGAANGRSQN